MAAPTHTAASLWLSRHTIQARYSKKALIAAAMRQTSWMVRGGERALAGLGSPHTRRCLGPLVVLGKRSEGGLGLPWQIGVGVAVAVFEDLDDAGAGQVEVVAGVAVGAVGKAVEREEKDERAVNTFSVKDLEQLEQVCGLAGLVADVRSVQANRRARVLVVLSDPHAARASVARTAVGAGAELSDRDRLPLRDEGADALGVAVGDLSRPVQIHAHEVEGCPVDALERDGGVGDPAAEAFADARHGIPEEVVDTPTERADPLAPSIRFSVQQQLDPVRRGLSAQEPRVHQAQLGADDEHDLGAPLADPLRPRGAVGDQREHRVGRQLERVRREPDLQAEVGGVGRGQLQPCRITAGDADGVAVQVVADDAQLALHDVRIESLARDRSITDEAGVVRDALGAHVSAPLETRSVVTVLTVPYWPSTPLSSTMEEGTNRTDCRNWRSPWRANRGSTLVPDGRGAAVRPWMRRSCAPRRTSSRRRATPG